MKNMRKPHSGRRLKKPMAAMAMTAATLSGQVLALEFETGNPDLQVRWDNTVRVNVAKRIGTPDPYIANSPNFDEGDALFAKNDIVSKRIDILSEADFVYKKNMGFRVSAALWYDPAYGDKGKSAPNATISGTPSYVNNDFSPYVKRYYQGPSGEFLDAFAFGNFDIGGTPVKLKAGRHTVFWGESLFLGGAMHSISYSQMPLDLQKGFATPGAEAKELFRPLNQISGQVQVTDNLSLAGQYFLQWESFRFPEGGTYLGPADFAFNGPDRAIVTPAAGGIGATRQASVEPKKSGEFGLSARWAPEAVDGTVGFYYRRYADKLPQALITKYTAGFAGLPVAATSDYRLLYGGGIDLYGISLAKNIAGVSVGAELSYRHNTPLVSQTLGNASAAGVPAQGETTGARGDTYHAVVNLLGTISKTPLFDAATWGAEFAWSRWNKVRSGENLFQAVGYAGCKTLTGVALGAWGGCATKDYQGITLAFTPTWYQVMPGVDLTAPMTYAAGIRGNAATTFGGNEGLGSFSVGLGADVHQKYRIDLKYNGYFGRFSTGANPAGVTGQGVFAQNGFTALLEDRNFLSLTFKTTF